MKHSNIGNVIRFEIMRNLKKPTFWIASLLLPVILVGYIALVSFLGASTESTISQGPNTSEMSLGVFDEAGYLATTSLVYPDGKTQELEVYDSKDQGVDDVKSDKLDAFYFIPADFSQKHNIESYSKPNTANIFNDYSTPIRTLLSTSAATHINPEDYAVLTNSVAVDSINFSAEDNSEINPNEMISKMIVPIIGAALFFILVMMFGNRLTTAMVEEKENRISEIILTSINPKDLIIGKIVSLIALGFIQIAVLAIPMVLLYLFGSTQNIIPADIAITFDLYSTISTILLVILSYFLYSAMCIIVGTLVPTAKDAASFSGILMILVILPVLLFSSFMPETPGLIVYIMSYFPPSAPIALMLRNIFGTLPAWELALGLANLALFSFLSVKLAVFIFRRSAIEFSSRVNLKLLFKNIKKPKAL